MNSADKTVAALKSYYGTGPRNWHTRQDPFKVLISTVLSQRTRDENTDRAARALFARYGTPERIGKADVRSIEKLIKPAGFYRIKAPRVKEIARIVSEKYGGKVPTKTEELLSLPGVGRKTANCVLVYGHGIHAIPVDIHVWRVSNRLGIVKAKTPEQTEQALMKVVPRRYWLHLNQLFVIHGQNICKPVVPKCGVCPVNKYCGYFNNVHEISDRRLRKQARH